MHIEFSETEAASNSMSYWERDQETSVPQPAKTFSSKKINYDDILNSLNLVVDKKGVLQYMTINNVEAAKLQPQQTQPQQTQTQQTQTQQTQQQQTQQYQEQQQMKNSSIYNKYFKSSQAFPPSPLPEPRVPKTIEEYHQMLRDDRAKHINEKNRIAAFKSTKLFFEHKNTASVSSSNPKLRKMQMYF